MDRAGVERLICGFVAGYPTLSRVTARWREPIVGVAAADDPLFVRFKDVVRPSHALPSDLLPGARSVVAWFVPFEETFQKANADAGLCSRSWAVAYVETNRMIQELSEYLAHALEADGHRAACVPPTHNFDVESLMSDWSHRHAAYAAGLGTFGAHNLLITEKGCAGRLGSLVTDLAVEPSPRPRGELCLRKAGRKCRTCVDHCTFGALMAGGYDRFACYRQCLVNAEAHRDVGLADVCGKCACGVPCSARNPVSAPGD
jgi:epoxyqueuosine reductase QueG